MIDVTASFCSLSKVSIAGCNSSGNSFGAISCFPKTSLGFGEGKSYVASPEVDDDEGDGDGQDVLIDAHAGNG